MGGVQPGPTRVRHTGSALHHRVAAEVCDLGHSGRGDLNLADDVHRLASGASSPRPP